MDISRHGWTLDPGGHEWLIGFPIGWPDCDAPATAWSRYKQQLRSAYLRIVQGSGLGRT